MNIRLYLSLIALCLVFKVQANNELSDSTKLGMFISRDFEQFEALNITEIESTYLKMIQEFKGKKTQFQSDESFLRHVFYRVHRKYLGQYEPYVTFSEIFAKEKKYDCVTGTAFYALIMDELGYSFEIKEFDYHVFLLVHASDRSQKTFMMESTDPIFGFITDQKEIETRQNFILADAHKINLRMITMTGVSAEKTSTQLTSITNNSVQLKELAGLHYYNQALKQFNQSKFKKAYQYIIIAQGIYPSKRIKNASSYMFAVAFGD